jgi:hypothetical protein
MFFINLIYLKGIKTVITMEINDIINKNKTMGVYL